VLVGAAGVLLAFLWVLLASVRVLIGDVTLRRLEEGRDGALVQEVDPTTGEPSPHFFHWPHGRVLRLTERGRAYYAQ
jgi:hypothetical protein